MHYLNIASSSSIESASYDHEEWELLVEFTNGSSYKYHNIPVYLVNDFEQARSAGTFFAKEIRPRYSFVQVH